MASIEFGLDVDGSNAPYTIVVVTGELDVYTAPRLREKFAELIREGHRQIIAELNGVDILDSTGLGVLVAGLKRLRQYGGDLTLVCSQRILLSRFRITGLNAVFKIYGSLEEAITS